MCHCEEHQRRGNPIEATGSPRCDDRTEFPNIKPSCRSEGGFSLIEILIVLGLIALVLSMGASMIGHYSPAKKMRDESLKLITLIKYVYFQASSENIYYRISFDLDQQSYKVESSSQPFYVAKEGDKYEELRRKNEADAEKFDSNVGEDTTGGAPPPDPTKFAESEDELLETKKLPESIRFLDIYVMHQKEKSDKGAVYLYFFPGGQTEFAVIHLANADDPDQAFTLIVNPLTGSVEVKDEYQDFKDILDALKKAS